MRPIRLHKLFIAFAVGLTVFLGIGTGHPLLMQQARPHDAMKMSHNSPCQSVCTTVVSNKHKQPAPLAEEDDGDPNPVFAQLVSSQLLANFTYVMALAMLLWAFLKRRPPDLILKYGKFRN